MSFWSTGITTVKVWNDLTIDNFFAQTIDSDNLKLVETHFCLYARIEGNFSYAGNVFWIEVDLDLNHFFGVGYAKYFTNYFVIRNIKDASSILKIMMDMERRIKFKSCITITLFWDATKKIGDLIILVGWLVVYCLILSLTASELKPGNQIFIKTIGNYGFYHFSKWPEFVHLVFVQKSRNYFFWT